jgi:hypothetical protein
VANAIAVIKVIGAWIVEVHSLLDEPQAQNVGVEIEITRRVAGDRRNVMDSAHDQ